MRNAIRLCRALLILVSVLQLAGCQKIIDKYWPGHGHGNGEDSTGNVEDYRIKKMKMTYRSVSTPPYQNGVVYYNQQNKPDSILFDDSLVNALNNYSIARFFYFKYNAQNQLTEYRFGADPGDLSNNSTHHWYWHNDEGRIIKDSAVTVLFEYITSVSYLDYDSAGRIYQERFVNNEGGANETWDTVNYSYDDRGNLARLHSPFGPPVPVEYDNYPSYLRTNDVWMFIERNYSKNNTKETKAYNDAGLPLGFFGGVVFGFLSQGDPYEIEYERINE